MHHDDCLGDRVLQRRDRVWYQLHRCLTLLYSGYEGMTTGKIYIFGVVWHFNPDTWMAIHHWYLCCLCDGNLFLSQGTTIYLLPYKLNKINNKLTSDPRQFAWDQMAKAVHKCKNSLVANKKPDQFENLPHFKKSVEY